jgi:hypothetical protein
VLSLESDPIVVAAVGAFISSYNLMIDSAGLQAAYITNDANSVGERDQLLIKRRILFPITFNTGNFIPACVR